MMNQGGPDASDASEPKQLPRLSPAPFGFTDKPKKRFTLKKSLIANDENNSSAKPLNVPKSNIRVIEQKQKHVQPLLQRENIEEEKDPNDKRSNAGEISDEDAMMLLKLRLQHCQKSCDQIKHEYDQLQHVIETKKIEDFGLPYDSTLFDLLVKKILLPDDWKTQIDLLINLPNSIKGKEILKGGDYFEALFQLGFAINIIPAFNSFHLQFCSIDSYKRIQPLSGTYLYTQKILSSGGNKQIQGISDICFQLLDDKPHDIDATSYSCGKRPLEVQNLHGKYYFFSVKNFLKEKSAKKDYDIPLLDAQSVHIENVPYENTRICVCIRDKNDFLHKLDRTKIDFIKRRLDTVLGYDELLTYFQSFRSNFFNKYPAIQRTEDEITLKLREMYPEDKQIKPPLQLYYHQELVVESVVHSIHAKKEQFRAKPHFITIGVLPRGGKSYIAGGIMNRLIMKDKPFNVLFLTSAVSETMTQFKDDLIEKFSDFNDFTFHDIRQYKSIKKLNLDRYRYNFIFMSRELASISESEELCEREMIQPSKMMKQLKTRILNPQFDIIFFDEAHRGLLTATSESNFKAAFTEFKIPILLMTATYKKTARVLDDSSDLFIWSLSDIKEMTSLPSTNSPHDVTYFGSSDIVSRYGERAITLLKRRLENGQSLEEIAKPYMQFPQPVFIHPTFTNAAIQRLRERGSGYRHADLFKIRLSPDLMDESKWREWHHNLVNREHAIILRDYLTPTDEELADADKHLLAQHGIKRIDKKDKALIHIFKKAAANQTRPYMGTPFTAIMFLPTHADDILIGPLCRVWGSFLAERPYWSDNFTILTLSEMDNKKCINKNEPPQHQPAANEDKKEEMETHVNIPSQNEVIVYDMNDENMVNMENNEINSENDAVNNNENLLAPNNGTTYNNDEEKHALDNENETQRGGVYELVHFGGNYADTCVKEGMCLREKVDGKDLKEKITAIERESLKRGKGLLILTGRVAQMGISLPCADVAFLLDSDSEADDIIQKMFRALTDSPGKKFGFIVDLNVKRIIKAMYEYAVLNNSLLKRDKLKSQQELENSIIELCDWGFDAYTLLDKGGIDYATFMKQIQEEVINSLDLFYMSGQQVKHNVSRFLVAHKDIFANLKSLIRGDEVVKHKKPTHSEEAGQSIPKGQSQKRITRRKNNSNGLDSRSDKNVKADEIYEDNIQNLVQTFINSLLFRTGNSIRWNKELTLDQLLKEYEEGKQNASNPILCHCKDKTKSCNITANLYERVYCDISIYIPDHTPKTSKKSKKIPENLKREMDMKRNMDIKHVMDIIYDSIITTPDIRTTLEVYIKGFLHKIDQNKSIGGRFDNTRKKRKYV